MKSIMISKDNKKELKGLYILDFNLTPKSKK